MVARSALKLVVVAGTLVPAIAAFADPSAAQLLTTTTTIDLPLPTSSTTTAPATTTTAPGGTASDDPTTTTTSTPSSTSSTVDPLHPSANGSAQGGLLGGGLSISVPTTAELSAGTPVSAGTLTATLGEITVTDDRAGLVAGWTASVTASSFVVDGAPADAAIPAANIRYRSGPATATTGTALFVPGQGAADPAQSLALPRIAFSAVSGSGGTSATWRPTVTVVLPATAISGQYHGTITHSVA